MDRVGQSAAGRGAAGHLAGAATALLAWWREAGADWPVAARPRPWLAPGPRLATAGGIRVAAGGGLADRASAADTPDAVAGEGVPVSQPGSEGVARAAERRFMTLDELVAHVAATAPGAPLADGNPDSGLLILGEAPSAQDLQTGRPFSGPAGALLDRMLAAIGIDRSRCYVTLLAPRSGVPGPPDAGAIAADLPLTLEHIRLVAPRLMLLLGTIPTQTLTGERMPIGQMRGRFLSLRPGGHEVAALATFNPAYLLRQPAAKREAWRDLLLLKRRLER